MTTPNELELIREKLLQQAEQLRHSAIQTSHAPSSKQLLETAHDLLTDAETLRRAANLIRSLEKTLQFLSAQQKKPNPSEVHRP
jgi:hypothetical protein